MVWVHLDEISWLRYFYDYILDGVYMLFKISIRLGSFYSLIYLVIINTLVWFYEWLWCWLLIWGYVQDREGPNYALKWQWKIRKLGLVNLAWKNELVINLISKSYNNIICRKLNLVSKLLSLFWKKFNMIGKKYRLQCSTTNISEKK